MSTLTFLFSLLVLSQVAVQVLASPSAGNVLGLLSRQSSGIPLASIPSQCSTACTSLTNLATNCADLSCICSNSYVQAISSCANCVESLPGVSADIKAAEQQGLQSLSQTCQEAGSPINIPVSGGSGTSSGSGSSSSGTGTNAATVPSATASSSGTGVGVKNSASIVSCSTLVTAFGLLAGIIAVAT